MHPAVPVPSSAAPISTGCGHSLRLLIFYHAGMAWSGWSWHVTSPDSLEGLRRGHAVPEPLAHAAALPGLGRGIMLALGDRTPGRLRPRPAEAPAAAARLRHGGDRAAAGLSGAAPSWPVLRLVPAMAAAGLRRRLSRGQPERHHLWFLAYVLSSPCCCCRSSCGRARHRGRWLSPRRAALPPASVCSG